MTKKKQKKYKHLKIKLYEHQFEVFEADGRKITGTDGCFASDKKSEILVAMAVFIDKYMELRKNRPLIISIEEGLIVSSKGGIKPS